MNFDRLKSRTPLEWAAVALFAAILIIAAWMFFEVIEDMVVEDPFSAPDTWTYLTLQQLRNSGLDRVMIAVTEMGDTWVVVAVAAAAALWLGYKKAWRAVGYLLMAVGGGSLINSAIKIAMQRARPGDLHYSGVSVFSFPSGHSTTNAALYGILIILVARELPWPQRISVAVGLVLFVGLIAFSRLYLGAHWLSDVGGGLIFASAWLAVLGLVYMWKPAEKISPWPLLGICAAVLAVAWLGNMAINHTADVQRYATRPLNALPNRVSP